MPELQKILFAEMHIGITEAVTSYGTHVLAGVGPGGWVYVALCLSHTIPTSIASHT